MQKIRNWVGNNPDLPTYGIVLAITGIVVWIVIFIVGLSTTETLTVTGKHYTVTADIYRWQTVRKYNKSSVPACAWNVKSDTYCETRDSNGVCIEYATEYDYSERSWKYFKTVTSSGSCEYDCDNFNMPAVPSGDYWDVKYKYSYTLEGYYRKGHKVLNVNKHDYLTTRMHTKYKFRMFMGKIR